MFRHITKETPDISISNNNNLKQILNNDVDYVKYYRSKWSTKNFKDNLYNIINNV
jgi:hypothetical protein